MPKVAFHRRCQSAPVRRQIEQFAIDHVAQLGASLEAHAPAVAAAGVRNH
jgi:hypothetical protein